MKKRNKLLEMGGLLLIIAGIYIAYPFVRDQLGGVKHWSDSNMGTDLSSSDCKRIKKQYRGAMDQADLLDADGQLGSEHCTSTEDCADMKGNYKKMLSKLEHHEVNCPWVEAYEYELRTLLNNL